MSDDADRSAPRSTVESVASDSDRRVRVAWFPSYGEVRHLLRVWQGRTKAEVTGLAAALGQLRGTPQSPVDWSSPGSWIPRRLSGEARDLALTIWNESGHAVNPRHIAGHWSLVQRYDVLEVGLEGRLALSERGRDFLDHPGGAAEVFVDRQEGLLGLLALVSDENPVRYGELIEPWDRYLREHRSGFRANASVRDTLRRRLNNLLDRGLIVRQSARYSATDAGSAYLQRFARPPESDEGHQIRRLAREREAAVRRELLDHLREMDPKAFEDLVARLLEEMDYQNVKVTAQSGDGGVDVTAEIELGVTSVVEVVQAKRHKRTVQRKDLDALRGSLYRFNAVRGTIVATTSFAKGAIEAAFAQGAAPITLIDGEKLLDLLIEHEIGVSKTTIELLSLDLDSLSSEGGEVDEPSGS